MRCVFFLALALSSASAQTAPAPAAGSIEGQILNANTGAPLRKASVRLVGTQPQNQALNGGRGVPPSVLSRDTDDQGRYKFTGLEAGRYSISATRTGFLRQSYGARRPGYGGIPVFLSDNQQARGIDMKMTPQAVIIGRVLDEDGDPMPNIPVRLMKLVYISGVKQWQQRGGTASSDIGEYRLAELEPGRYLVGTNSHMPPATTGAPDKPEMIYAATYYPRSLDENSASPIEVGAGSEIRGIDVRVMNVPAVRVRGSISNAVDGAGRGRGGVQVGLVPRDGGAANVLHGNMRPNDGTFEIRGVQPGSYLLWARLAAGQPSEMFVSQPLDVGPTAINGVVLTLAPAMDVPVRVTVAESDAQVDLSRVVIRLRPLTPSLGGGAPMARSQNGQFVLHGVTPLRYAVNVGGMPDGCYLRSIRYGGQELTPAGADFNSRDPLDVVLSAQAGQIAGTVNDKDGHTVLRAIVVLIPNDASLGDLQAQTTDDNGAFTFDRLHPGQYKVLAWEDMEPGAYQDPEFRKLYIGRAADINVGPRDQQKAQLRVIATDEMK